MRTFFLHLYFRYRRKPFAISAHPLSGRPLTLSMYAMLLTKIRFTTTTQDTLLYQRSGISHYIMMIIRTPVRRSYLTPPTPFLLSTSNTTLIPLYTYHTYRAHRWSVHRQISISSTTTTHPDQLARLHLMTQAHHRIYGLVTTPQILR